MMRLLVSAGIAAIPVLSGAQTEIEEPDFFRLNPGPWGTLEARAFQLTPDRASIERGKKFDTETVWDFVAPDLEKQRQLFAEVGFSPELTRQLLSPERMEQLDEYPSGTHYAIRPTEEAILALTPRNRALLYTFIRATGANSHFWHKATIENDAPFAWFHRFGVSESTARLAERLCYRRGQAIVFSDHNFVLSQIENEEERISFYQAVHQTSALELRLQLAADSDIDALARYWAAPGNAAAVRAQLESLRPKSGVRWLDVAHLFPSMPRSRLNTFQTDFDRSAAQPDCRWTALNFFAEITSERRADLDEDVDRVFSQFYERILPPFRFGDVIAVRDQENGAFVHSCVYVADDVVFTKNGRGATRPWILQRDRHLSRIYVMERPVRMEGYRLRPASS